LLACTGLQSQKDTTAVVTIALTRMASTSVDCGNA
jgi:hypothetical protein